MAGRPNNQPTISIGSLFLSYIIITSCRKHVYGNSKTLAEKCDIYERFSPFDDLAIDVHHPAGADRSDLPPPTDAGRRITNR